MTATTTIDQDDSSRCPFCGGDLSGPCTPQCFYDHNGECVGCRTRLGVPCPPVCPLETGELGVPVILRFAAKLLDLHNLGLGCDVAEAVFTAAQVLADEREPYPLHTAAVAAVKAYLTRQYGPGCGLSGRELMQHIGLMAQVEVIALTLYAVAAEAEGIKFNAADFGDFR